jgi:hypothetical protein
MAWDCRRDLSAPPSLRIRSLRKVHPAGFHGKDRPGTAGVTPRKRGSLQPVPVRPDGKRGHWLGEGAAPDV